MAGKHRRIESIEGKVGFSIRLDKEVARFIKQYATEQKRPYSGQIELILEEFYRANVKEDEPDQGASDEESHQKGA